MTIRSGFASLIAGAAVIAALARPAAAGQPSGHFMELLDQAMREVEAVSGQPSTPSASPPELVSVWNTRGCGFTDTSNLPLSRPTRIDRIDLWYNWSAREASSPYEIMRPNGQAVAAGTLTRDSCDPYQATWCVGTASPGITLPPGSYLVRTPRARICQNAASKGAGFIKAWGATVAAPPRQSRDNPPAASAGQPLGKRWDVHEEIPGGRYWTGTWTRRQGTNLFDATWTDSLSGQRLTDVIELRGAEGHDIRLYRQGNGGTYSGTLSSDGSRIRGTASWYPPGAWWSARIGD